MSFASYAYVLFLATAFVLYWLIKERWRKPFLIAASYVFYGSWDYRFTVLLFGISVFSWAYGLLLAKKSDASHLLSVGVLVELSPLGYFKYTNFLLDTSFGLVGALGLDVSIPHLDILLPLGVSFFCFQGVAYLVDVASGAEPIRRFSDFLLYKAFWPQLIAGPIIRPDEIREQLESSRSLTYDDVSAGGKRIVSGLFKKVVLADTMGRCVDAVFVPHSAPGLVDGLVGSVGFGLQIYWDFAGYSEIAIGSARLFGYRFPENFDWPYAARSPQEFWNRWHMTLSSWIRDYVFTPLSFALRRKPALAPLALLVAMGLCGLWHGAAWTFVLWGLWHGAWLVLNQTVLRGFFKPASVQTSALRGALGWAVTFAVASFGWILFRAQSLEQVGKILQGIVTLRGGLRPTVVRENDVLLVALFALGLFAAQLSRGRLDALTGWAERYPRARAAGRAAVMTLCVILTIVLDREAQTFVYFQF